MTIDDATARSRAQNLETILERSDAATFHNALVAESQAFDKDSFTKIADKLEKLNALRSSSVPGLPDVSLHHEGPFNLGNVDQIVLSGVGVGNKKVEVFETSEHRQKELDDQAKQSEPLHIDFGRIWGEITQNDWVGSTPDFQTDSSVAWSNASDSPSPTKVVDHRSGTQVGALDMGNYGYERLNGDDDLQQRVNNPPPGYNPYYRTGR